MLLKSGIGEVDVCHTTSNEGRSAFDCKATDRTNGSEQKVRAPLHGSHLV